MGNISLIGIFFYSLQGLNNWICRELLNHVTPLSNQDRISLHNNKGISSRQIMRMNKYTYQGIIRQSNTKLSKLAL